MSETAASIARRAAAAIADDPEAWSNRFPEATLARVYLASVGPKPFLNACRVVRCIDRYELANAGLLLDEGEWRRFRGNPIHWLLTARDHEVEIVWSIVEKRCG